MFAQQNDATPIFFNSASIRFTVLVDNPLNPIIYTG